MVVNEALNEDGTYRSSPFYDTIGEAFLPLAFKFAKQASPKSELFYNDYNLEYNGNKTLGAQRIVINPMLDPGFLGIAAGLAPHDKAGSRFLAALQMELDPELGRHLGHARLVDEAAELEVDRPRRQVLRVEARVRPVDLRDPRCVRERLREPARVVGDLCHLVQTRTSR